MTQLASTSLRSSVAFLAALCLAALPLGVACGSPSASQDGDQTRASVRSDVAPSQDEKRRQRREIDVILVTLDTLRADVLGFAGHPAAETPLLDRLASEGRWFRSAYAHNVVTLPSHANILTGLYPYQHGVRENSGFVLSADVPTLATRLRSEGWATAAFVGAYPLDSRFGLDRGFEVYDDSYSVGLDPRNPSFPERPGNEVVAAAKRWWDEQETARPGTPRFVWVHLYDPHAPYAPPEPWRSRFPRNPYLGEVAATDAHLRPLLETLLDAQVGGAKDDALVIVTSDHGEGMGDHGEMTHGLFAYEPTLRVPLILWGARVETGADERSVGHVDLAPTILDALGLPPGPMENLAGRSLLSNETSGDAFEDRTIYFEALSAYFNRGWAPLRGLISGGTGGTDKLIELPLPELYDLSSDSAEAKNLLAENPATAQEQRFAALQDRLPEPQSWPPGRGALDPDEVAALQALGYVTDEAPRKDVYTAADDPKSLIHLDRMYHESIDAYHRRDLQKAERLTRAIVAERPDMSSAYGILVMTLREAGRPLDAIGVIETAMEGGYADDDLLVHLGSTYAEIGRPRRAIEVLEPLLDTGLPNVLASLGIAYSDAGRQPEAKALLERLLAESPDDTQGHENYGVVLLRLQRPAKAQAHFERALELNDNLPFSWNNLGVSRAWQGDERGALEAWQRAIALDPNLLDALYNLGLTAAKLGEPQVARRALSRYVEIAPAARFGADIQRARQILERLP